MIIAAIVSGLLLVAAGAHGEDPATANRTIGSFEETFAAHAGDRANRIDSICAIGEFAGTSAASVLSRSKLFAGDLVPVVARFSRTNGDPRGGNVRELAVEFRLRDGSRQHIAMLNTATFV